MSKCYRCGVTLVSKAEATEEMIIKGKVASEEHIIPRFCGGHLTSNSLLCQACNNWYGQNIDSELDDDMLLARLFHYKLDGGGQQGGEWVKGITSVTQTEVLVNRKSGWKFIKPSYEINENDEITEVRYPNTNEIEARKFLKGLIKKYPKTDPSKFKFVKVEEYLKERIDFSQRTVGSKMGYRAVAKIAVNFYLFKGKSKENIQEVLEYINNPDIQNVFCNLYYSQFKPIRNPKEMEISHVLYLKGDKKEELLYCYIELFNTHCYLIMLNTNYDGPDFKEAYCYDVLESREIDASMELTLWGDPFYPLYGWEYKEHTEVFERFWENYKENTLAKHKQRVSRAYRIHEEIAKRSRF